MQEDSIEYGQGDFQVSNSYECARRSKHMKAVSSTGCCKFCGSNKIYFVPSKYSKYKI